eukprot:TRINITY_DN3191_c0_g1_i2.p1 TRINITY_DN3191_c0_g1~~TRINITY_DN3191_c0_g1_i2.p1  ORF type:complete len:134 (-),score=31.29 TRINITY_DN3191_c0_g1_i2:53-454(-)
MDPPEFLQTETFDVILMIFVLSALSPAQMPLLLQKTKPFLRKGGLVLFRDYAEDDLAQKRFDTKPLDSKLDKSFYVRKDGTCAYFFTKEFTEELFEQEGFVMEKLDYMEKEVVNKKLDLAMNRRFIQAKFSKK